MFHRYRSFIAAPALALATLGLAGQANAASYTLGGGSSVDALDSDPGLVIETYVHNLDGLNFNLNDGESFTFDFFDIWTDETTVNDDDPNDDTMPYGISAFLDFAVPSELVQVDGETVGERGFMGFFQNGQVTWDDPVLISHAGGQFKVELSNETFNNGIFFGTTPGEYCGATVQATITQLSSQVVPTPSAAAAGLMLAGLGMLRRRRMA